MQAKCSSCGAVNPSGKVLCISCGKALVQASAAPAAHLAQPVPGAYQTPYQSPVPTTAQSVSPPAMPLAMPPAVQPVTSPVQRPQVTGPAAFTQSDLSGYWTTFLGKPEAWFGVGLLLFFFLPWISIGGFFTFAGYQVPSLGSTISQGMSLFNSQATIGFEAVLLNVVYLVPVIAIATIVAALRGMDTKIVGLVAGILPLLLLAYGLLRFGGNLFQFLGLGAYLTIAAAIGMILVVTGTANRFRRT